MASAAPSTRGSGRASARARWGSTRTARGGLPTAFPARLARARRERSPWTPSKAAVTSPRTRSRKQRPEFRWRTKRRLRPRRASRSGNRRAASTARSVVASAAPTPATHRLLRSQPPLRTTRREPEPADDGRTAIRAARGIREQVGGLRHHGGDGAAVGSVLSRPARRRAGLELEPVDLGSRPRRVRKLVAVAGLPQVDRRAAGEAGAPQGEEDCGGACRRRGRKGHPLRRRRGRRARVEAEAREARVGRREEPGARRAPRPRRAADVARPRAQAGGRAAQPRGAGREEGAAHGEAARRLQRGGVGLEAQARRQGRERRHRARPPEQDHGVAQARRRRRAPRVVGGGAQRPTVDHGDDQRCRRRPGRRGGRLRAPMRPRRRPRVPAAVRVPPPAALPLPARRHRRHCSRAAIRP